MSAVPHLQPIDVSQPIGVGATHVGVGEPTASPVLFARVYGPLVLGAALVGGLGAFLFKKHRVLGGVGGAMLGAAAGYVYDQKTL
jgi:hypothetical protein